jgi:trans-2,3-dihydro-3-hydroxyanthranilate isomerase
VTSALWTDDPESPAGTRSYLIADVFTRNALEGNQLGVFLDGRDLETAHMQRIARELNLSETVFFEPPADPAQADARIRIFTPVSELPFAGHPTLGSAFVLADLLGKPDIRLETGVGTIPVKIGATGFGEMEQPVPVAEPFDRTDELLDALGVTGSQLPVEQYRNGPRHVYVTLRNAAEVARVSPDWTKLAALGTDLGVSTLAGASTTWKTRMFAPGLGVREDPATGSAAGPLAVHLARHGQIPFGEQIEISQGKEIGRPSLLYARVAGTPDKIEHVFVGGSAVIVARGDYRIR